MVTIVDGLVRQLRAVGIPVALSEHIDATRALGEADLFDRQAVWALLRATLVKDASHHAAFDLVFDLYFTEQIEQGVDVCRQSVDVTLETLSDDQLCQVLVSALGDDNAFLIRQVIGVMVDRHAGFEPGMAVAGMLYRLRTMRAINPDSLHAALLDAGVESGRLTRALDRRLAAERADEGVLRVEREVDGEIRRRLVADRGADQVAETVRRPLPEDVDFLRAARRDADAVRSAIQPLAVKLASGLAARRSRGTRGVIDVRRTLRAALSTGGVPVDLVFRPRRAAKPRLVVLADISGSVATFAAFTLQLVYALRTEFAAVRSFVFVDAIDEVTDVFAEARDIAEVPRTLNERASGVWFDGQSDYGRVFESFRDSAAAELSSRTIMLVLGDGRNNYHEPSPDAFAAIAARAGRVYWLNPEPGTTWDSGDSVIGRYAPFCDRVVECRSIRQLRDFVESL